MTEVGRLSAHRDHLALTVLDDVPVAEVLDGAVHRGGVLRLLFETRRTTDVERTHRQLRSRFADRLSGDNADRFADLDRVDRSRGCGRST